MAYNGSGVFLINSAGQPVVANTVISATVFNALTSDLATGLSTAITKDGQTTITNNIPFGSNKITGLGSGTAAADAANLGQVQSTVAKLITVTGTDTITGSMSPQLTAYAAGQLFYFVANAANTGAVTLNIDSLGAKSITRDGSSALAAGDINSGEVVVVIYDGTRFQMINAANSFGNTTINGTLTVTGNAGFQANVSITSALSVGGVFAVTGAATFTANPTLSGGTANGVLYLNGSKVATSGSALTFDGTTFGVTSEWGSNSQLFTNATASISGITARYNGANKGYLYFDNSTSLYNLYGEAGISLAFTANAAEGMRLTSTGLGIGTASPSQKLSVNSGASTTVAGFTSTGSSAYLGLSNSSASIFLGNDSTSGSFIVQTPSGSFSTKLTLDNSGNLGLGVTPSAWGSSTAFDIGSYASVATWSNSTNIGNNFYRTSTPAFIYKNSANATLYQQTSAGSHIWYNAPSGTAGNAITFTQVLAVEGGKSLALEGATSQSGTGITFPATQSASSNANTLDDYEEGTWTGTVSPNTSGTITLITSDDTGAYTKIGRQVTVTGHFQVTSVSSPVGVLVSISGLPFTIGDGTETSQRGSGSVMFYDNSASTASTRPVDYLEGQTSFRVWIDASTVETNDSFIFTVTYFV